MDDAPRLSTGCSKPRLRRNHPATRLLGRRAPLAPDHRGAPHHPRVGFSILVNGGGSVGSRAFTQAHALFHHQEKGLVSRTGEHQPEERFANYFAAYFLVPGKALRRMAKAARQHPEPTPFTTLRLAAYFRVSYTMMLIRLEEEWLVTSAQLQEWRQYSPLRMARRIGLSKVDVALPMVRELLKQTRIDGELTRRELAAKVKERTGTKVSVKTITRCRRRLREEGHLGS